MVNLLRIKREEKRTLKCQLSKRETKASDKTVENVEYRGRQPNCKIMRFLAKKSVGSSQSRLFQLVIGTVLD